MNWRDLLYFSKGERRALTLLAVLITAAWLFLLINESSSFSSDSSQSPDLRQSVTYPTEKPRQSSVLSSSDGSVSTRPAVSGLPATEGAESPGPAKSFRQSRTDLRAKPAAYPRIEKFAAGTVVELNTADTLILKKVPGIGSAFARRIVNYRRLLGGFYTVGQLGEVYGIDEERYERLSPWFRVDTAYLQPIRVNRLLKDTLPRHPYLNYRQLRVLRQQLRQKGKLAGWENLSLLEEFTEYDRGRLQPYLSFE